MSRAPIQVIVIPFRQTTNGSYEFAVFHRSDGSMWQFLSGGAEDNESPVETAKREAIEEAGIVPDSRWIALESRAEIPRTVFPNTLHWPQDLVTIPEFSFAVDVSGHELTLSDEHDEVRWLSFNKAVSILTWESNMIALAELRGRLGSSDTDSN
ncbi:MAG: NUDIX pyrophosphatase [candidate division Zixibacteria bacterium]|nr:NUDIX pyrophosphatase [candidate division Zixibacteria bacterium]